MSTPYLAFIYMMCYSAYIFCTCPHICNKIFALGSLALRMTSLQTECLLLCAVGVCRRHPPAAHGPCVLADLVREAPRLLDFLPPESRSALSATSNLLILGFTKVVTMDNRNDLPLLCKGSWPQLASVVLRADYQMYNLKGAVKGNIRLLAALVLSAGQEEPSLLP